MCTPISCQVASSDFFATSIYSRYTSAPVTGKAPSIGNAIGSGVADTVSAAYDGVVSTAQTAYSGSLNTAKQSACASSCVGVHIARKVYLQAVLL